MGSLTVFLQHQFKQLCPEGWRCASEQRLLDREMEDLLGYAPRIDVVLSRLDGSKRLWIEFEVSRADPVANHAKYATSHLFVPRPATDTFLAMVSAHVTRGRRNLAANALRLMRHVGLDAFQTVLLPTFIGDDVKRLNHMSLDALTGQGIRVEAEIERALVVTQPLPTSGDRRLFFVADLLDVMLNLRRWNLDMATSAGRATWGRRTVTYFAFDTVMGAFAPSKFCAYTLKHGAPGHSLNREMTIDAYASLERDEPCFDGAKARQHLCKRLAMEEVSAIERPDVYQRFTQWNAAHENRIGVHPSGPRFLLPPAWFR